MELDITALDMLPAQEESPLYPCNNTCSPRTCGTNHPTCLYTSA
ncbi:ALQxL family class IV lanthipeptide [Streptosporangium sp. NPDC049376]